MTPRPRAAAAISTGVLLACLGCSGSTPPAASTPTAAATSPTAPASPAAQPSPSSSSSVRPTPAPTRSPWRAASVVSIPSIGVRSLRVIPYVGKPDDGPGTRIQNKGSAATPHGPGGGVGPGEIGNFIITGHRTTAGGPLERLPALRHGAHVLVTAGGVTYDYRVTATMKISFRKPRDLARQAAAVPGRPGVAPTRAMLTLSTCATPEDKAAGNLWTDEFGNHEHRINKIAVLVAVTTVAG